MYMAHIYMAHMYMYITEHVQQNISSFIKGSNDHKCGALTENIGLHTKIKYTYTTFIYIILLYVYICTTCMYSDKT